MDVGRDGAPLDRLHHLDEPGHSGRGLEVAHVGLHRPDEQRVGGAPALRVDGRDRVHLDRIAKGRTGSVRFDVLDLVGAESRSGQDLAQQRYL